MCLRMQTVNCTPDKTNAWSVKAHTQCLDSFFCLEDKFERGFTVLPKEIRIDHVILKVWCQVPSHGGWKSCFTFPLDGCYCPLSAADRSDDFVCCDFISPAEKKLQCTINHMLHLRRNVSIPLPFPMFST